MEAVPRLPMISFPGRTTSDSDELGSQIKKYIRHHYNEDPESYNSEIFELEGLRRSAINASTDFVGCSTLKKYFCQLSYLASRFPFHDAGLKIVFNWYSAFDHNSTSSGDISLEIDSIMYNIATLHTSLGALDSRTTADGMKISCTHFQCAAWAFQTLAQHSKGESELNPLLMNFMMSLSLSQAQECILEKSMTDHRKPNIIAKVSMQVVEYLKQTIKNLESFRKSNSLAVDLVGSKLTKMWQRHCLQSEEQQKMGERLAYLQGAVEKLEEASKSSKNLEKPKAIGETLAFANDVIKGKQTAFQKENEFVYHEKVPPLASLSEVKGASLVKGIPFSINDIEVAGPDIFGRLVPMEAHQASSMYSEEKAKLLRMVGQHVQEKNEELETYLASMQLDSLSVEDNLDILPQELVECCADLNSRDALKELTVIMSTINQSYHDIKQKISRLQILIKAEEEKEKEFAMIIGTRRVPPNQLLNDHKRELAKYQEAHEAAMNNNQALHAAITQHRNNISTLSLPLNQLLENLPSAAGIESEGDRLTRMEVQRILNKVGEMQVQRRDLDERLRNDIHQDDITKQLVTNQEEIQEFFDQQLKKHDPLVALLEQNMRAQVNIIQALSEANATYGSARRQINHMKSERIEMIDSLICSYNTFLSITHKANDAKEFYSKLESQVNKVESKLKSICKVQEEEREGKLGANVKKFLPKEVTPSQFKPPSSSGPKLKDFLFAGAKTPLAQPPLDSSVIKDQTIYPPSAPSPNIGYAPKTSIYNSAPSAMTMPSSYTSPYIPSANYTQDSKSNAAASLPNSSGEYKTGIQQFPTSAVVPNTATTTSPYGTNYHHPSSFNQNYNPNHSIQGYGETVSWSAPSTSMTNQPGTSTSPTHLQMGSSTSSSVKHQMPYGIGQTLPAVIAGSQPVLSYSGTPSSVYGEISRQGQLPTTQKQSSAYNQGPILPPTTSVDSHPLSTSHGTAFMRAPATPLTNTVSQAPSGVYGPVPDHGTAMTTVSQAPSGIYGPVYDHGTTSMITANQIYSGAYEQGTAAIKTINPAPNIGPSYSHGQSAPVTAPSQAAAAGYGSLYSYGQTSSMATVSTALPTTNMPVYGVEHSKTPTTTVGQHPAGYMYAIPQAAPAVSYGQTSETSYNIPPSQYASNSYARQAGSYQSALQQYPGTAVYLEQMKPTIESAAQANYYQNYTHNKFAENKNDMNFSQQGISQDSSVNYIQSNAALITGSMKPQVPQYSTSKPSKPHQPANEAPVKKKSDIISNIDLLSDIDLNPSSAQWSLLQPNQTDSGPVAASSHSSVPLTTPKSIEANSSAASMGSSSDIQINASILDITKIAKQTHRSTSLVDPLSNDETLNLFVTETEKFAKFVQGLDKKPLNGPTNLELKWKELLDITETKCAHLKVSVGRCYPLSNRFPDNLPFDSNRVQLPSARDDYINASYVQLKTVDDSIPLIMTQAPLSNTMQDFWTMVWENHVEIIVCLNTDAEVKGQVYIPKEGTLDIGSFSLILKQTNPSACNCWIQQTLLLHHNSLKASRVIIHTQFLTWPPGAMPESPGPLIQFVNYVHCLQKQQRNTLKSMVIHCISGTGRSGVFAILSSCIKHLQTAGSSADIWNLLIELSQQRRTGIQDKSHLLFLYSATLYNAQEALMKRGILSGRTTFEERPREKTHVRHPSADLLSSDLSRIKAKLGFDNDSPKSDSNLSPSGSQSSLQSIGSQVGVTNGSGVSNSPLKSSPLPPNLAASLDPEQLDLSGVKSPRITKESFLTPSQGLGNVTKQDGADPFADIDPLWKQK